LKEGILQAGTLPITQIRCHSTKVWNAHNAFTKDCNSWNELS